MQRLDTTIYSIISVASFTWNDLSEYIKNLNIVCMATISCLTLLLLWKYIQIKKPSHKIFLLDFVCYKPPTTQMCTREMAVEQAKLYGNLTEEMENFMRKILERGGIGDSTYLPEALLSKPPNPSKEEARREAEAVMFGAIDKLLAKTSVQCKNIDILVVNCSIFNVVPSLASMIVNRYKLRDNIISYNLSGMGCSAGLLSIGLAEKLLQVHRNSYALVVSTENITENSYLGKDLSKFVINCLFRVGGAAMLLSNHPSDCESSKYQLIKAIHTHTASSDFSYNCIFQEEDEEGQVGVTITKDLLRAAIQAIESNVNTLAPLVLPLSEKYFFLKNCIMRYFCTTKIKPYTPDFCKAIDHFFPHVGGKPVLDELQRSLGFDEANMEASRMTLYRFGNTSSSTVWYELAYAEAKGQIKSSDLVWQMAFGSGFKCNSAIWRAIRTIDCEDDNPWKDEIDEFPVVVLQHNKPVPFFFEPSKSITNKI